MLKPKIKPDERMGRTIKISDVVFELLNDVGKKSETYSQVIERIAKEAHYEIKPEYVKR
jgi:predicted CopG family antitoxin